jgi:AraC-like DNA-binding protein
MKKLASPYFIFLFFISFFSIFKVQAQSKYEDSYIEKLNKTYQFEKSIKVARFKLLKANSSEEKLFYNNCIIRAYTNMEKNDSMLIYMKYSLELLPNVQDSELICYTYLRIGIGYKNILDINNSSQYLLKAINIAKKINCLFVLVKAYSELGNLIITENLNMNLALYYLNISIKYSNDRNYDINNSEKLASKIIALVLRGSLYSILEKTKEGFNDLFLAKTLVNKLPNNVDLLKIVNNQLSFLYLHINDRKNSEKYINEALKISLAVNDKPSIRYSYRYMAEIGFHFKDYYKAIFYSLKADNYSDKNNEEFVSKIYVDSIVSLSYQYIGEYENALKYYKSYTELKNKYYEKNRFDELNKLEVLFKVEENEKKLALNNLEQTKDKATIQILLLIIFLSILILVIFFGYKYLESKRKKIIFKNIENSDKEINSIKDWQEWRNNSKALINNVLTVPADEVGNNYIKTPAEMIDTIATAESEINAGAIGENNLDAKTSHVNYTNLYFELRELLETKKLYLNPNLILEDLIKELSTNKNYLYYAIKSNYVDNFKSLLNDYRINHVKSLIVESVKNNQKIRMEDVQESSGFQSAASFFRVFKSKTGLTPLEYAEQVKLTKINSDYSFSEAKAM